MEDLSSTSTAPAVTQHDSAKQTQAHRMEGLEHSEVMILSHDLEKSGMFVEEVHESDLGWYVEVYKGALINAAEVGAWYGYPIFGADYGAGPVITITRHAGRIILAGPWLDRPWDCDDIRIAAMQVSNIVRHHLSM